MVDEGVPLFCSICPKRPTFSDISHLLTHIGSKGHLSNYYRGKIRSAQDAHTRQMIDEYDAWYNEWGLEDLMAERISLKDKKKLRSGATSLSASATRISSGRVLQNRPANRQISGLLSGHIPGTHHSLTRHGQSSNLSRPYPSVDPRLVAYSVKHEEAFVPSFTNEDSPRLPPSTNNPWTRHPSSLRGGSLIVKSQNDFIENSHIAESRSHRYFDSRNSAPLTNRDDTEEPIEEEYDDGSAKLKGVLWPGMSIFDSATVIARRRRNQKKDESVINRLKENSELVDCTEVVYNPDWSINKQRFIDGLPSSPPPESPQLLASMPYMEANDSIDVESLIQLNHDSPAPAEQNVKFPMDSVAATPYGQGRYNLRNEVRSDQRVRYQDKEAPVERKKRSLSIYRDERSYNASAKPNRLSVLTRSLEEEDDDEYVPSETRVQRRRLNGNRSSKSQLSFHGRLRPRTQFHGETDDNEEEVGLCEPKPNLNGLISEEETAQSAPMTQDQFNYGNSSSLAPSFDQSSMFSGLPSSMSIHSSYGGSSVPSRHHSSLSVDNFGNGSFGIPFSGQMNHPGLSFGQYPGRTFGYGFGLHGMPLGFNHGNMIHGMQNDFSMLQFGLLNGIPPTAPEFWGCAPQEDPFGKINGPEAPFPRQNRNALNKPTQSRGHLDEESDLPSPAKPSTPTGRLSHVNTTRSNDGLDSSKPASMAIDALEVITSEGENSTEKIRLETSTEHIAVVGHDQETDDERTVSEVNSPIGF